MRIELSAADEAFRGEVRAFLETALTPELREAGRLTTSVFTDPAWSLPWQRALHARGWAAPAWPVKYGGAGWNEIQRYIFASACAEAGAPSLAPMGLRMCGPVLMRYGTPEQKAQLLPRILSGEDYWCQGYSEPGAGSDLASLQLRAESDGDDYVLNGSKIWTTHAQFANRMFCLVRTGFEGRPQAGITFLLLEMDTPGLTIRPLITLAGDHEVNQVFFENVRVPKSGRVGEENAGWTVAKYLLEFERGGAFSASLKVSMRRLKALAAQGDPPLLADRAYARRLAEAEIELQAIETTEQRVMAEIAARGQPGPASSLLKTRGTEAMQMLDELAIEAAAHYGAVLQPEARVPGGNAEPVGPSALLTTMPRYLNNRAASIYGGSNEIQRNIMAHLVLGL